MKPKTLSLFIFIIVLMMASLFVPDGFTQVIEPQPRPPETDVVSYSRVDGPAVQTVDDFRANPKNVQPPRPFSGSAVLNTGGPDDYGYIWNDSVALNWIDATDGTDTGMSGNSYGQAVGPISLPFTFDYYENSYTSLYIAASGYLSFTDWGSWPGQPRIPSPLEPNNIIAPYATLLELADSGPANRVYYKSGGTAPDRYFIVEWYQVEEYWSDNSYTFEVILYENGDILFQYQNMSNPGPCGSIGIEDSWGWDGLTYIDYCTNPPSNKAVRYFRPSASVRVNAYPSYQGQFVWPGGEVSYQFPIRHTGDFGADTFDLSVTADWPVSLYNAGGTVRLTDTDGDGVIDSGTMNKGEVVTVTLKMQAPADAYTGDNDTVSIAVRSSLDSNVEKTVNMSAAVPASFAQVFRDDADGAMSVYLAQPFSQTVQAATASGFYGRYPVVAEMPDNTLAYLWTRYRCLNNSGSGCTLYGREIEYTLLDQFGGTVYAASKLTEHSSASVNTYDEVPTLAVTPNGRIGLLWYRYLYNPSTSQTNYNIYFAILDASGSLLYGPVNLTNNTVWGTWGDFYVPLFYQPRIAATGDNRFILAWRREHQESSGYVSDIYYAVRDSNGNSIKGVTKLTNDTPGSSGYYAPALASLSANRAFLSWISRQDGNDDIYYVVVGSDGNLIKPATNLSVDESVIDWWNYDVVQLSDGKILAAWEAWGCFPGEWTSRIRFVLLDAAYNRIDAPVCLGQTNNSGDTAVSVTADWQGNAILTWTTSGWLNRDSLYYALVGSNGSVLTPPMTFLSSKADYPYIESSTEGYGNTSYNGWLSKTFLPIATR